MSPVLALALWVFVPLAVLLFLDYRDRATDTAETPVKAPRSASQRSS